jgi:RNA polymerase sigma-70 factor (ECF subfamily)
MTNTLGCVKPLDELVDEELFIQLQNGQQAAFDLLHARYDKRLRRRIRRSHSLDSAALDDVMQEVWLQVYSYNKVVTNFHGFVFGMAANQAGKCHTKRRQQRVHSERLKRLDVSDEIVSPSRDRMIADETESELNEAMRHLPKDIRQALRLVAFFNLSVSQVAAEMGLPERSLRRQLKEARTFLKESIF